LNEARDVVSMPIEVATGVSFTAEGEVMLVKGSRRLVKASFASAIVIGVAVLVTLLLAAEEAGSFAGTWQGSDVGDGSVVTVIIEQDGSGFTIELSDSYSVASDGAEKAGYAGSGTGTVSGSSAEATLQVVGRDGDEAEIVVGLTLSDDVLTLCVKQWSENVFSPPHPWADLERTAAPEEPTDSGEQEDLGEQADSSEQEDLSGQDLALEAFALGFFDPFTYYVLPDWEWINPDPGTRRITEDGMLEIDLVQSSLYRVDAGHNVMLQEVPGANFTAEAHVIFEPTANFQFAGIVVMADNQNSFTFGRTFTEGDDEWSCPQCRGNAITFSHVAGGRYLYSQDMLSFMVTESADEAYLRVTLENGLLTAYYSEAGVEWQTMTFDALMWVPTHVGLFTSTGGQPVDDVSAKFDYFAMQEGVTEITWVYPSDEFMASLYSLVMRESGSASASSSVCLRTVSELSDIVTDEVVSSIDSGCLCGDEVTAWLRSTYSEWLDDNAVNATTGHGTYLTKYDEAPCGSDGFYVVLVWYDKDGMAVGNLTSPCFRNNEEYDDWYTIGSWIPSSLNNAFTNWWIEYYTTYPDGYYTRSFQSCTP